MTFSIIGIDKKNREIGVACFSKAFALGGIVPAVELDSGAVATQSYPNVRYKFEGLNLMKKHSPEEVIEIITGKDKEREIRQVIIMNSNGKCAGFSGRRCVGWAGQVIGKNCIVAGNMLVGEEVIMAIKKAFEDYRGRLADRLISALSAGEKVGGDKRNADSSAAIVVEKKDAGVLGIGNRYIDLRVDDSKNAISDLKILLAKRMEKEYSSFHTNKFKRPD